MRTLLPTARGDAHSVLVVAPDDETRRCYRRHLERLGYAVATAGTLTEALACARRQQPDLLLLEPHLPSDADWLRRHPATRAIRLFVLGTARHARRLDA